MKIEDGVLVDIGEICPRLVFPKDMTDIGDEFYMSFGETNDIETIEVEEGNPFYHSAGNCLIETQTKTLVLGCKNSVIPDDGSVTKIGKCAFNGCQELNYIAIPDCVTELGYMSFAYTGLKEVVIPETVTKISSLCFVLNPHLKVLKFKSGNAEIGEMAFGTKDEVKHTRPTLIPVSKANDLKIIIPGVVKSGEFAVYNYAKEYGIAIEEI